MQQGRAFCCLMSLCIMWKLWGCLNGDILRYIDLRVCDDRGSSKWSAIDDYGAFLILRGTGVLFFLFLLF